MEGSPIRNARRGDIPSLVLLAGALLDETARDDRRLAPHPRARENLVSRFTSWIADPNHVVVVAEEDGRLLVGFAAGYLENGLVWQGARRVGRITECYVVPPRRRGGLGRRLAMRVADGLELIGADALRMCAATSSPSAIAFWRAVGFEPLDVVMERELDASDRA